MSMNLNLGETNIKKYFRNLLIAAIFAMSFFAFSHAAHAANVYYSVGQSSSSMLTGTPTMTISSNVATFSANQTGNIGVGDRVTYGQIDISSFADQGGGVVRITTSANHGYSTGDYVSITGTTNYNGNYQIANAATDVFDITHAYTAEAGGATKYAANIAFIASKTSQSVWTLTGLRGSSISDRASATTVNSITREYTSLSAAETGAIDANHLNTADLETNSYQLNFPCYYDTGADTTAVTVDGYTTGVSNYIKIYTPSSTSTEANNSQRHQGKWEGAKYRLSYSANSYTKILSIADPYVRVEGLLMEHTNATADERGGIIFTQSDITISGNIVRLPAANGINDEDGIKGPYSANIYNNIVVGWRAGIQTNNISAGATQNISNNTIYDCNSGIGSWGYPGSTTYYNLKNNLSYGNNADFYFDLGGNVTRVNQNNLSSDATSPNSGATDCGGHSCRNQTVQFADAANQDFHLSPNDTVARNSGANLYGDSSLSITTDIDGHTRPNDTTFDIGADESATAIYYSVGQNTNDHSVGSGGATCSTTGACTITIASGVATFNYAQTETNIGVGDKVTYNTTSVAYISQKISQTQWKIITATGGTPADVTGQTVNSIAHAFLSLTQAIGNGTNGAGDSSHLNTSNLKVNNYQLNIPCYYDTGASSTSLTMATGYITSLPNYIRMYTPTDTTTEVNFSQRHTGKWDNAKFAVDFNGAFNVNIPYTKVDGLQFNLGSGGVVVFAASERVVISNNIVRSSYSAVYGIQVEGNASKEAFVYNNIVYGFASGIVRYYDGAGRTLYAYNNTVYNCSTAGIRDMAGSSMVAVNNVVQNSTDGYTGIFLAASDYNISDLAADAPGSHSKNSATVSFADATNSDFHLVSTDTAAKGAGTDLQHDSYFAFENDIDGQTRVNPWDIGADQFQDTVLQSQQSSPNPSGGLIGHWTFDGQDIEGTTAKDTSGYASNGTIYGTSITPGKLGQAEAFDGLNTYINVGDPSSGILDFGAGKDFSYSFWFKRRNDSVSKFLLSKGAGQTASPGYAFILGGGKTLNALFSKSGEDLRLSVIGSSINDNNWHHVVVSNTRSGNCVIYLDSIQNATGDISSYNVDISTSYSFIIGAGALAPSVSHFGGSIDDVRLYDRALSATEVGLLYRQNQDTFATQTASKGNTNGLVGYWSFDGPDVSGTTAYDRSGNGNNGTIYNTPSVGPGKIGQALNLNGSSQYIYSSIFNLGATNTATMSAWIKSNSATGGGVSHGILYKCSTVFELRLQSNGALNTFLTNDVAWHSSAVSPVYTDWDQWHHVVAVYNGSNVIIYRDGAQVGISGTETGNLPSSSQYLSMGRGSATTSYWDGKMDDIRIYNRALTADEIGNLYHAGLVEIKK